MKSELVKYLLPLFRTPQASKKYFDVLKSPIGQLWKFSGCDLSFHLSYLYHGCKLFSQKKNEGSENYLKFSQQKKMKQRKKDIVNKSSI